MSDPGKVELLLCFNDSSKVALSIPLAQCTTFAITPLKWLTFLGFAIYGRQGYISMSTNGPELDCTAQIEARSYHFISDGEPRFADVDAMDNRTSSASDLSSERADFRQTLIERDGTCVLSDDRARYCDACHFIPHSKGDSYMSNLFNHRLEIYGLVDPLDDINDTRNGILLNVGFRRPLAVGVVAFLKTPKFALTVDDIPYHQPPNAGSPANRLTMQHIQPSLIGSVLPHFGHHNSDARQPQDISQWLLAMIVDLSYAAAVLRAWGPKTFIEYVQANSRDSYYEGGVEGASRGPTVQVPHQPTGRTIRYVRWSENKARADQPSFDIFDVVLSLWKRAAREGERRPPGSDAADAADNGNKIQTWLQSVEESEHAQERLEREGEENSAPGGQDQPNERGGETAVPGGDVHGDTECPKDDRND